MKGILQYILANKQWIFSGIGVAILSTFLLWLRKRRTKRTSRNVVDQISVGGNVVVIGGSRNVVNIIEEGINSENYDHLQSDNYNVRGRERVRAFAERAVHQRMWDWYPLGQAIEFYVDSIKYDPKNQHPWVNLGYVYHLIGERQKALECLDKAFKLATPGRNYPGHHYTEVKTAVDKDTNLVGREIIRPPIPDWFRKKYERFLP